MLTIFKREHYVKIRFIPVIFVLSPRAQLRYVTALLNNSFLQGHTTTTITNRTRISGSLHSHRIATHVCSLAFQWIRTTWK
jgi:hypothetical protein